MADSPHQLDPGAEQVLFFAREEARHFNHNYVGTEHLLLGLLRVEDGLAASALESLGADLSRARNTVELIIGRGERQVMGDIGLTPRAKKIMELAADESTSFGSDQIRTEHILLGLIAGGEGIAAAVLESLGVSLSRARRAVIMLMGRSEGEKRPEGEMRPSGSFDRFTGRARTVLTLAQEEAQRLNHNHIGTEHLWLGLTREGDGVAARVLSNLGVGLTKLRNAVELIIGRGERQTTGDIGLTPMAKKVIELAVDEARRLGHHYIGTEHLLLGLIRGRDGIASGMLESMGLTTEKVRGEVIRVLTETPGAPAGRLHSHWAPTPTAPEAREIRLPDYLVIPALERDGVPHVQSFATPFHLPRGLAGRHIEQARELLGSEGWELVGIVNLEAEPGHALYVFRRPA